MHPAVWIGQRGRYARQPCFYTPETDPLTAQKKALDAIEVEQVGSPDQAPAQDKGALTSPPRTHVPIDHRLPPHQLLARVASQAVASPTTTVIKALAGKLNLIGADVTRLTQNGLLNDEVINAWGLLLNTFGSQENHISSSWLWRDAVKDVTNIEKYLINNTSVRFFFPSHAAFPHDILLQSPTKAPTLKVDVFAKRRWLVPAHINDNHWVMLEVDLAAKSVRYYDSMDYEAGTGLQECQVR